MSRQAEEELEKILLDERIQPITYNHYYIDNIQKARAEAQNVEIQKMIDGATTSKVDKKTLVTSNTVELQKLATSIQSRGVVDMTEQACLESLAALNAYYKVKSPPQTLLSKLTKSRFRRKHSSIMSAAR